jgi:hypothetical protein
VRLKIDVVIEKDNESTLSESSACISGCREPNAAFAEVSDLSRDRTRLNKVLNYLPRVVCGVVVYNYQLNVRSDSNLILQNP